MGAPPAGGAVTRPRAEGTENGSSGAVRPGSSLPSASPSGTGGGLAPAPAPGEATHKAQFWRWGARQASGSHRFAAFSRQGPAPTAVPAAPLPHRAPARRGVPVQRGRCFQRSGVGLPGGRDHTRESPPGGSREPLPDGGRDMMRPRPLRLPLTPPPPARDVRSPRPAIGQRRAEAAAVAAVTGAEREAGEGGGRRWRRRRAAPKIGRAHV